MSSPTGRCIRRSYPEFPDNCFLGQFTLHEDVLDVFVDGADIFLEQLRHQLLRQPHGLVLKPALNARPAILRLVEDHRRLRLGFLAHGVVPTVVRRMPAAQATS
jgi:hypothetical protein